MDVLNSTHTYTAHECTQMHTKPLNHIYKGEHTLHCMNAHICMRSQPTTSPKASLWMLNSHCECISAKILAHPHCAAVLGRLGGGDCHIPCKQTRAFIRRSHPHSSPLLQVRTVDNLASLPDLPNLQCKLAIKHWRGQG